ncbi:MAG TPA: biotin--[acetyl-CoA-carboxylase] ligase [bacterium]|nr:biotin--[acetyl-CoA-carboxylase] ligase [bacterium]
MIRGRKVCGILTEMSSDMDRIRHIVLGIGVNVNVDAGAFPDELADIATSLKIESGRELSRLALLGAVIQRFEEGYQEIRTGGFEALKDEWISLCDTVGKHVRVTAEGRELDGVASGVDFRGNLVVRLPNGMSEHIISGDVAVIE